jgi:hypothetical protein
LLLLSDSAQRIAARADFCLEGNFCLEDIRSAAPNAFFRLLLKFTHPGVASLLLNQNAWVCDHWIDELPLCSMDASPMAASLASLSQSDQGEMSRLIAAAFALALASSAEALPLQPQQPAEMLTLVREACGPGMQRVNGVCRRNATVRRAGAADLRLVNGRCIQ